MSLSEIGEIQIKFETMVKMLKVEKTSDSCVEKYF